MPTYEYACKACDHRFETWQSMSDDPLTICPVCGGELRKVFAPPAITFKGSGFYATDHGKKKAKSAEPGSKKEAASASSSKGSEGSSGSSSAGSSGSGAGGSGGDPSSGSKAGGTDTASKASSSKGSSS